MAKITTQQKQEMIAAILRGGGYRTAMQYAGISQEDFDTEHERDKSWKHELAKAYAGLELDIAQVVAQQAVDGCRASQKFWLSTQRPESGWGAAQKLDLTSQGGPPVIELKWGEGSRE